VSVTITSRTLRAFPRERTRLRRSAAFRASYSDTVDLLVKELSQLRVSTAVVEVAVDGRELRADGLPRATANPSDPGVVLWFVRNGQNVCMPCDRFDDWQDNLRAIAKSLEALRAVDRYGVTTAGEQYQGWTRLGQGNGSRFESKEAAASFLSRVLGNDLKNYARDTCRREVEKRTHPDKGGSDAEFKAAQEALSMLGL